MNTHEYQAKSVLIKYGIPVPPFYTISRLEQLPQIIEDHHLTEAVIKVQVHAGGRGKAGGVKFARSSDEILKYADELLGKRIINAQTGKEGLVSTHLLISVPVDIEKEYYLGAIIDRKNAQAMLMASPEGGMDIEEVAQSHPEKILKLPIPLNGKFRSYQLWEISRFMGWQGETAAEGMKIVAALAKAFIDTDASLLEINPLVKTKEGRLYAVDAKLAVDENALWRQPEIKSFYDPTQLPRTEVKANEHELSYVSLDGDIGCMVNGAGLAMATMDIIHYYGGRPANFLDVGGGATIEKVAEGFKLILSDPNVKAVLVNIFGGIMNCETLANGLVAGAKAINIPVPLVVRMEGTNVDLGKKILEESKLNIIIANSLQEAAQKVVEVAHVHPS